MRILAIALIVAAASPVATAALPAEPPADPLSKGGDSLFHDGLAWSLGLGSAGLAVVLGALYVLGVGGLRHVDRANVLEHPMRQQLLRAIQDRPGIHLRELASAHETAVTNTQWHLRKLEQAALVKTQKVQGRRLYYPVQGGQESKAKAIENAALRNPNAERVTEFLAANAGCNQRALAEALGMNPGTVRWHLRKLESAGLVRVIQEGAHARYFLMKPLARAARPAAARAIRDEEPILVPTQSN
ncbi:MAG TPA: winged helix-turn-helix transcriptional regulator [Candidatus Thermoplasmatota archaeon]|nr:winged helix-turn-helix transcriptional regulator [Candidatus Thermoplasmatota archaeon]